MKTIETIGKLALLPAAILAFGLTSTATLTGCGDDVEDAAEEVREEQVETNEAQQDLREEVAEEAAH